MKKYGNKILAILLTAVCLIGVLPLSAYGATEQVCYPAQGTWYPLHRYSQSSGGYVQESGIVSLIVPIPDSTKVVISGIDDLATERAAYYLDADFNVVSEAAFNRTKPIITLNVPAGVVYVSIVYNYGIPYGSEIYINDTILYMTEGDYTLAHPAYCDDIVVPDPPLPPVTGVQVQSILDMWEDLLLLNVMSLTEFYNQLIEPMGLIIGIPVAMAIIGIIIFAIGGKKR